MKAKHTPGPWKEVDGFIVGGPWADGEFHDICDPRCAPPDDDNAGMINANAQLIAAAPAMLEALRYIATLDTSEDASPAQCSAVAVAMDAIDKATK
jgi:hypothetical protein